ncbi:MAG: hypothetical protein QHH75_04600 [Bacillota bacterium]|nr:hypothetical protein [Bacillota bacterium]
MINFRGEGIIMENTMLGNLIMWGTLGLLFVFLGALLVQLFTTFKLK